MKNWILAASLTTVGVFSLATLDAAAEEEIVWSGDVRIPAGMTAICTDHSQITSLDIPADSTVRFQTATAPTCPITGTGTIVKDSVDTWTPTTPITGFSGDYRIAKGVACAGTVRHAFGNDAATTRVSVEKGATLAVTDTLQNLFYATRIHLAGEGALAEDGVTRRGALEMPAVTYTSQLLNNIILDDDATLYVKKNGLFFLNGMLDVNGHRLTTAGEGTLTIFTGNVPDNGGEIYLQSPGEGLLNRVTFRTWNNDNPPSGMPAGTSPFVMSGGSQIQVYGSYKPVNRPLWVSGQNNVFSYSSNGKATIEYATNNANWAGPVTFTNTTGLSLLKLRTEFYSDLGKHMLVVSGPITGPGSIDISNSRASERCALLARNNTYTGYTRIGNDNISGTLLGYPGSVPANNYAAVTNCHGYIDLAVGDGYDRWTLDDFYKFSTQATFLDNALPRFSSEYTTNGIGPVKVDLATTNGVGIYLAARDSVKFIGGANAEPWSFNWCWGRATLTGPDPILLGQSLLNFRPAAPTDSEVRFENADVTIAYSDGCTGDLILGSAGTFATGHLVVSNSLVRCEDVMRSNHGDAWKNVRGGTVTVGYRNHGTLEVLPGTVMTNRLVVCSFGDDGPWTSGGRGAVYQRGGRVVALGGTAVHLSSGIGMGQTYGYYELTGGSLEGRGNFSIGGYGTGVFAQYGGEVLMTNRLDQASTAGAGLQFSNCNGGNSVLYLANGSFVIRPFGDIWAGKSTDRTYCEITLDGPGASFDSGSGRFYLGWGGENGFYCFNFNGGTFRGSGMQLHTQTGKWTHENTRLDVNFNGGTYKVGAWGNLFGPTTDVVADREQLGARNVVVFKGGMTIDTDGKDCYIASRIRKPSGYGIKTIKLAEPLSDGGYVGSPRVLIDPGTCGATATAFAHYDSTNCCIDAIRVTSPGEYAGTEVSAKLAFNAGATPAVLKTLTSAAGEIELEENDTTGSFTKAGAGQLALLATNTWGGATVLAGGTLKCSCDCAIPQNTTVELAGGVLAMNGKKMENGDACPKKWAVDAERAKELGGTIPYAGAIEFLEGSTLEIRNAAEMDADGEKLVLLETTGGITGRPAVVGTIDPKWHFRFSSKKIVLAPNRGTVLIVR